jgi:NTE family protein
MKIGLALSGGGVLGVAHLGVLRQLEKNKIKVSHISGTSAGAIIGALYSHGGVDLVETFLDDVQDQGLFDTNKILLNIPSNIFSKIEATLQRMLPEKFSDLKIDFVCSVTNFAEGHSEFLSEGLLVPAIMASSAFPGVFPSRDISGKSFVDGGITRNLPAGILREKGADFVIGSSLYNIKKMPDFNRKGTEPGRFLAVTRSLEIMQKELANYEAKMCDFCFMAPVETFNWFNFDKAREIEKLGDEHAALEIVNCLKILKAKDKKGFWRELFSSDI